MKNLLILFCLLALPYFVHSQTTAEEIFEKLETKFSTEEMQKIRQEYEAADEQTKAMMRTVFSMPMSSKKELIDNYENKQESIKELIGIYNKQVPKGYIVFLELKTSDRIPGLVEGFDLQIYKKNSSGELILVDGDWDLKYESEELDRLLAIIDWDKMTLLGLKNYLQTANCISIQNGDQTEVGFARSGLGKYFYIIFQKKLTKDQQDKYNDGCEYIYYKDNVVLKYVGGMAGPQCFTD